MRFTGKLAALVSLALSASVLTAGPAHASVTGSLTPGTGVIYSDCSGQGVPYSLSVGSNVDRWTVEVNFYAPDGTLADFEYLFHDEDPTSGIAKLSVCEATDAGTYTVKASGTWSDDETDQYGVPFTLNDTTVTVRPAKTKTKATGKGVVGRYYKVSVKVTDERPNGYYPTEYADVKVQKRANGKWVTVKRSREVTNAKGRASFRFAIEGPPYNVRFVTNGEKNFTGSTSNGLKVL